MRRRHAFVDRINSMVFQGDRVNPLVHWEFCLSPREGNYDALFIVLLLINHERRWRMFSIKIGRRNLFVNVTIIIST